jgi:flavin reductase (DIM6/NTAB) family NADH-FMN oxidoreductase RutF
MQTHYNQLQIAEMEKQQRVHFINSLGGFKSVSLVGTQNNRGETNLAIFSSVVHLGANPALIALIFRPSPPERNTLSNILQTGFYTLNHINTAIYKQAHQTSARYPQEVSEFDATGLQLEYNADFQAPFVAASHIKIGLEFKEKIDIAINNTTMLIGEIKHIFAPTNCICKDGFIDIEKANTLTCSGLDSYHETQKIERLSYAKPDKEVTSLKSDFIG